MYAVWMYLFARKVWCADRRSECRCVGTLEHRGDAGSLIADRAECICHSRTKDLPSVIRNADILIAAIGKAEFVRGDWVKPGAAVIDVGINSRPDAMKKSGYRLVGDVNFDEVKEVAGFITPVPGGVGPMTIAMLMRNTARAAEIQDP